MIKLKGSAKALRRISMVMAAVVMAAGFAPLMLAGTASAEDGEQNKAWKNIALLYTTDIKGKIEPCG